MTLGLIAAGLVPFFSFSAVFLLPAILAVLLYQRRFRLLAGMTAWYLAAFLLDSVWFIGPNRSPLLMDS
jgi:hypothetical protein